MKVSLPDPTALACFDTTGLHQRCSEAAGSLAGCAMQSTSFVGQELTDAAAMSGNLAVSCMCLLTSQCCLTLCKARQAFRAPLLKKRGKEKEKQNENTSPLGVLYRQDQGGPKQPLAEPIFPLLKLSVVHMTVLGMLGCVCKSA